MGKYKYQRTAIFDLLCEDDQNREFIIEIQRISQKYFLDRSVFYVSSRIQDNAPKGKEEFSNWDFCQKPIFFIGILDFDIKDSLPDEFEYFLKLCDIRSMKVFYDKLSFIFLELPKFERLIGATLSLESVNLNKWLYAFKKLHTFQKAPDFLSNGSFNRLLEIAEIANMTKQQKEEYEKSLIDLADSYATHKTAREEGFEEGKTEGIIEGKAEGVIEGKAEGRIEGRTEKETQIIKNLLNKGTMSILEIAEVAAVDEAYVLAIKDEMDNHDNEGINQ